MYRTLLRALPAAALLWCGAPQAQDFAAATNKVSDGGFESASPSYWTPSGAGAVWSTDEAHSGTHSLALSGAGAASWTQAEVVRNWTSGYPANTALTIGFWANAQGVNTNPGSDAAKFQLALTFRDADGNDILGQDVVIDLPQDAASTNGWVRVTSADLGEIILPVDATSVTAVARKGANATGTVYLDDFYIAGGPTWHGTNVDLPGGWYTFWPGFEGGTETPEWVVAKTTEEAHTGDASVRIERLGSPTDAEGEAVIISPRVPAAQGEPMLVSYWLKTDDNADPSTIGTGDNNVGLTALWYSSLESGAAGYNEIGGADIRLNGEYNPQVIPLLPRQADNGWTQYAFVVNPIAGAVGMELRLRYWHQFTGVTYWDDVFIGDVPDVVMEVENELPAGAPGFEGALPSYWTASGAGAVWSTDEAHSGTHSLALSGAGAASWTQAEVVRNWTSGYPANTALTIGFWANAQGVNTNPGSDAAKFQLALTFRDADGNDILGQDVVIDLPQDAASTNGWVRVTSADLGEIILPVDATSVTAVARKGANATGTVYLDDFYIAGGPTWHGTNVDLPGGWYTFWPGFEGGTETPEWVVAKTTEEAHTGDASVRIERLGSPTDAEGEAVIISPRVPAAQGEPMLVSYWLKTDDNADPSTIGTGDNNVGLTALWYSSLESGAAGYNEIGGADIRLNGEYNPQVIPLLPRQADNGWTNYAFVLNPIANTAGMEVRLRYWQQFTGATHWDDVALANIAGDNLVSTAGEDAPSDAPGASSDRWLRANAPNPFGTSTEIRFELPTAQDVTLEVYDLVGRRVALLADGVPMGAGAQALRLDGAALAAGSYLVVLRTLEHSEARQITVVR